MAADWEWPRCTQGRTALRGGAPHSGVPQRAGVATALASGVPVDSVDDAGVTALFVAAMNGMAPPSSCALFRHVQLPIVVEPVGFLAGHADVVELLLAHSADASGTDGSGDTALM